jgi:phage shock protein A
LSSDIEELLEEFADLKKKYQGMGEELRRAEGEVAEFRRMNTFLDLQVKKLKEEKDFAEAPEEIERLNTLLVERDIAIEKIK